jgi:predicted Ser/Thr protein kinase
MKDLTLPTQVGNYKLEKPLGAGGQSKVFLARHVTIADQSVVVKLLTTQEQDALRRFKQEADILARLRHPHIVRIFDYGLHSIYSYMVLEYIPGPSLAALLQKQKRLPLPQALTIFRQLAAALDHIHACGVVHRDVSANNVLLSTDVAHAYLLDFGIARDSKAKQSYTVIASFMGTQGYCSPEHALSPTMVTHLSDQFCLGILLYQMLSGRLPWPDQPPEQLREHYTPPPTLRQLKIEGISQEVDAILLRLLAQEPKDRYADASAAVAALEAVVAQHTGPTQILGTPPANERPHAAQTPDLASTIAPNAVELVLAHELEQGTINDARRRAADLATPAVLADLLNTWSAQGRWKLRRPLLGRMAHIHKVSSANVYFYRLRVLYETRTQPNLIEQPDDPPTHADVERELDRWAVELPPVTAFTRDAGAEVRIPGSTQVCDCPACKGRGIMTCTRCKGERRVIVMRSAAVTPPLSAAAPQRPQTATSATGRSSTATTEPPRPAPPPPMEPALITCPSCEGRGGTVCDRCLGAQRLVRHKTFQWSRFAKHVDTHDDLPDVDEAWLVKACRAQVVYTARNERGMRPEWLALPQLKQLIDEVEAVDVDTRIVLSEVTISLIPVTAVVFDLGKTRRETDLYKIFIYGFENHLPADWHLLDWERITTALALTIFCLLTITVAVVMII